MSKYSEQYLKDYPDASPGSYGALCRTANIKEVINEIRKHLNVLENCTNAKEGKVDIKRAAERWVQLGDSYRELQDLLVKFL